MLHLLPNSYPTEEQFRLSECDHSCFTRRLSHTLEKPERQLKGGRRKCLLGAPLTNSSIHLCHFVDVWATLLELHEYATCRRKKSPITPNNLRDTYKYFVG